MTWYFIVVLICIPLLTNGVEHLFMCLLVICVYIYFIFGCVGSLLLRVGFFSSCGEEGLLFVAVRRLLIAVASLVAEHGL